MPGLPAKPCAAPGCGVLVRDGSARCPQHKAAAWGKRPDAPARLSGRKLQEKRRRHFANDPLCVMCQAMNPPRVTLATELDHVLALCNGGDLDGPVQGLCEPCHAVKTAKDLGRSLPTVIGVDGYPVET